MKLRHILKRSFRVCFDFDGSKFVSSGDLLFVKYFIHQLSHCEFIQLRKCQRGVFQNHGVCGQAFPFLASPPPPRCFHQCCARPNFCAAKKRKVPPTGGKPYRNACYAGYQWCSVYYTVPGTRWFQLLSLWMKS